jgi:hypothetical protein
MFTKKDHGAPQSFANSLTLMRLAVGLEQGLLFNKMIHPEKWFPHFLKKELSAKKIIYTYIL